MTLEKCFRRNAFPGHASAPISIMMTVALILESSSQWADAKKIVSMDPLGHLAPWLFSDLVRNEDIHIRPTIAVTKAHMKLPELESSVQTGRLVPDGKICLNRTGELAVTKFAVEPGKLLLFV